MYHRIGFNHATEKMTNRPCGEHGKAVAVQTIPKPTYIDSIVPTHGKITKNYLVLVEDRSRAIFNGGPLSFSPISSCCLCSARCFARFYNMHISTHAHSYHVKPTAFKGATMDATFSRVASDKSAILSAFIVSLRFSEKQPTDLISDVLVEHKLSIPTQFDRSGATDVGWLDAIYVL